MANGIEDLMNIRTMGGTQNVPPRPPMGRPTMGGQPPMGQPPMARPPMGGGIASMSKPPMGGQPPMKQPPIGQPPMSMEEPPIEEPKSIEQDAAMLAEATIGRTGGDSQAAVAILDTAKAMLMQGGEDEPMMMADGGGLNPGLTALAETNPDVVEKITGKPLPDDMSMGGPLYAQEGTALTESETMKQMIMNSLQDFAVGSNPILGPLNKLTQKQQRLQEAYDAAAANSQTGRTISDKDQAKYLERLRSYRMQGA